MKLEELREHLRAPAREAATTRKRKRKKRVRSLSGDFGISFTLKTKDGPVKGYMYRCKKCKKRFVPDPKLSYVPSVCAKCDTYW